MREKTRKTGKSVRIGLELEQKLELWISWKWEEKANEIIEIERVVLLVSC